MRWRKTFAVVLICCTIMSTSFNSISAVEHDAGGEQMIELAESEDDLEAHLETEQIKAALAFDKGSRDFSFRVSQWQSSGWQTTNYRMDLLHSQDGHVIADVVEEQSGVTFRIDSGTLKASVLFVPLAVVVGELLLAHVLLASTVVVIAGVTYIAASEVANTLRNRQREFYAAILDTKKGLFIGDPLTLAQASARLNSLSFRTNNVWSISKHSARLVAQTAGGLRTPLLDMAHGPYPLFMPHFHRFDRRGGHSFFS